jgi:hypothetical protein
MIWTLRPLTNYAVLKKKANLPKLEYLLLFYLYNIIKMQKWRPD